MRAQIERLKDWLGINRYVVEWDFVTPAGLHLRGSSAVFGEAGARRAWAERVARFMNEEYGQGSHWVVPAVRNNRG